MISQDRPRERLVRLGPRALLDAELIELLIGTGTKGAPAPVVATALLAESGSLAALATWDTHDFGRVHGLGPAKAAELGITAIKVPEDFDGIAEQRTTVTNALVAEALAHGNRLAEDGRFGDHTREAVLAFQKQQGLVPDGIAGRNTHAALATGRLVQLQLTQNSERIAAISLVTQKEVTLGPGSKHLRQLILAAHDKN